MGRGQYDRAAAKAKRDGSAARTHTDAVLSQTVPQTYAIPPTDETAGDVLEIVRLRAEIARKDDLIARYAALLKRNGLWLDG